MKKNNIEEKMKAVFSGGWDAEEIREALGEARSVVLVAHMHADGDAVGSLIGMTLLLEKATGARCTSMLPDGCPEELGWMPQRERILDGKKEYERCTEAIRGADLLICLDLNTLERCGRLAEEIGRTAAPRLLIDHHEEPNVEVFRWMVSEPEVSSTCELVYWVMHTVYGDAIFTPEAATALYGGICTDTGTFSYSNTRPSLYMAAAALIEMGVDPMDVNRKIRNVFTEQRLKFFGHAMDQLLRVCKEEKMALMVIRRKDMEDYGVGSEDLTGLVNEVMRLKDVDCAVLVREEEDGTVRLSLRSKRLYDVNAIARRMYGGGGHQRAAGATSSEGLQETVETVCREFNIGGKR